MNPWYTICQTFDRTQPAKFDSVSPLMHQLCDLSHSRHTSRSLLIGRGADLPKASPTIAEPFTFQSTERGVQEWRRT
jgi:hypothetical protein